MADATFGVKMPEELKKQIENLIKDSGLRTGKDFMQNLINNYVVEKTKENIPDVAADLKELQTITQRTNDIYLNMGYRIENINKANEKESQEQLSKKDSIILDLQNKIESINFQNTTLEATSKTIINENKDQLQRVNELTESNNNIKALIEEYKSKNDMILGQLNKYEKYPDEIVSLKNEIVVVKDELFKAHSLNVTNESQLMSKDQTINSLKDKANILSVSIDNIKVQNNDEIKKTKEESKIEVEKGIADTTKAKNAEMREEIISLKEEQQEKIQSVQNEYTSKINEYQDKYKSLLDELEHFKAAVQEKEITNK